MDCSSNQGNDGCRLDALLSTKALLGGGNCGSCGGVSGVLVAEVPLLSPRKSRMGRGEFTGVFGTDGFSVIGSSLLAMNRLFLAHR